MPPMISSSGQPSYGGNLNIWKKPLPKPTLEQLEYVENYRQKQPDKLASVADFLNRVLMRKDPVYALVVDFRTHKRTNDWTKMTAYVANPDKNRYKDVGCLDNNRVVLHLGKQPYIHANYVGPRENPKKLICCQAPLDSTIVDFWTMVAQERCRCIVMLCNYTDNIRNKEIAKCARYLPSELNVPQTHGEVTVTSIRSDNFAFKHSTKTVVVRTIVEVTVAATDPSKRIQVEHLQWQDWPDAYTDVPPVDVAPIELIQYVQKFVGSPIIVHSSAGIGRAGCFVLMDLLLDQFSRGIPWPADLMTMVREIRQSRNNVIQTRAQYLYCNQVLVNFLSKEGILSPDMVKTHLSWTLTYTNVCEDEYHKIQC